MKAWPYLLTVVTVGFAVAHAQDFVAPRPQTLGSSYVGAGSCAASACHGNHVERGTTGSEYAIWGTRDPHAKAYQALFNAISVRIQKSLGSTTKPHEDRRCLQCHVGPDYDEIDRQIPYFRTDGVSCETCHGPARQWLTDHYAPSWRTKTPAQKRAAGMKDTHSVLGRVQLCATCHVGDVDHDLIAAGHPRLAFEFTAFHHAMPHHWRDAQDQGDFEIRAWLAGQLVTAHASLNLLADRASDERKPWPEFAEHDCAACHHDLASAKKPARLGKAGDVPWSVWNLALTPQALQAIDADADSIVALRKEMANGWHDRKAIAVKARQAAARIKPLLERVDRPLATDALLRSILDQKASNWDETAQIALALTAISRDEDRPSIRNFARALALPGGSLDPLAVRKRLIEFKAREGR